MGPWTIALAAAFAGEPEQPADIVASRGVLGSPEKVWSVLTHLDTLQDLYPTDCAEWLEPFDTEGLAATARVVYYAGMMQRPLRAIVKKMDAPHTLDLDHPGEKGFVTRFSLTPEGELTRVTMTTYLNPPPWPVKKYFYRKVKPAWEGCHARTLANLDAVVRDLPDSIVNEEATLPEAGALTP